MHQQISDLFWAHRRNFEALVAGLMKRHIEATNMMLVQDEVIGRMQARA
jgi:hypothetical protein